LGKSETRKREKFDGEVIKRKNKGKVVVNVHGQKLYNKGKNMAKRMTNIIFGGGGQRCGSTIVL
jgi:hypothetical protein